MAKLHNYYVLCPLIDQKSFLGVAKDKETQHVIVTLGRNVVNKYQLSDQKQVGGWTSRDHITSAVLYNKRDRCYVGVFNNNTIKTWKDDSDNLDKLKKYKFPLNILKLIPRSKQAPLIIFSNGNCASLPYAIENRKTYENKSFIKETDTIVDAASFSVGKTDHICYIVKNGKGLYEILFCPLRDELGDMEKAKLSKIKITRQDEVHVVGAFIAAQDKKSIYVLWSDSKMTEYNFNDWRTVGTVPWISTRSNVSMSWMGKNHLILFGSNMEQDGALIITYNIDLGVGSCRYPMKMYSENAKLYCFHDRIILEASNHIGMLPYVLETKRNLRSLLGSHEITQDEITEIANWDSPTSPQFLVTNETKDLLKLGLTERSMCTHVIPPLLEKNDFRFVFRTIQQFKDVPELVLVMLLKYTIKLVNSNDIDFTNTDEVATFYSKENLAHEEKKEFAEKLELLNYLFNIMFSDALIIPHLRNGITLNDTLFLMTHITHLLVDPDKPLDPDYESKLYDWCTLLMDAFYQQYLMTADEKVTHVLQNALNVIVDLIKDLHSMSDIMAILYKMLSTQEVVTNEDSVLYSIELLEI